MSLNRSAVLENGKKALTMTKEYIEREALKEDLKESYDRLKAIYDGLTYDEDKQICAGQLTTFTEAILRVKEAPAADVAPVVHGRWIEKEKYTFGVMYDCSICDNLILDNGHSWNYCPNCGAIMDGGAD